MALGGAAPGRGGNALLAGMASYVTWGFVPLAFQAMGRRGVGSWEILAHRTLWSVPLALLLVLAARQWRQVARIAGDKRVLGWLAVSSLLIAVNWVVFIAAVNSGRVLETSLGYYITPLLNMAAGAVIFRERIDRSGLIAMALAAAGVAVQALAIGSVPTASLIMAVSFGGYGIIRKRVAADAQTGLFVESLFLGIPGLIYVLWLDHAGAGHFLTSPITAAWLVAAGVITVVPLALFAWAARRVPLSQMGFLQFLAPTISFLIGLSQGEVFTPLRAASFMLIWAGAALYAVGAWRRNRAVAARSLTG